MPDLRELLQALTPNVPLPRNQGHHTGTSANGIDQQGDVLVYQPPDVFAYAGGGGANFLPITGGRLLGPLLLAGDPVEPLGAVTKQYADAAGVGGGPFLPLTGGQLSGPLLLQAAPVAALGAATKAYVDGQVGNRLIQVSHNVSMLGAGTAASPLSLNPASNAQIAIGTDGLQAISSFGLRGQLGADASTLPTAAKTVVPAIRELWAVTETLEDTYVSRAGDTMLGDLDMVDHRITNLGDPVDPTDAASRRFVQSFVTNIVHFRGLWQVAANNPDLITWPVQVGDFFIAATVDPNVPELADPGIPGIGGDLINHRDWIIWQDAAGVWLHLVAGSGMTPPEADARYVQLAGSTMTGFLSLSADPLTPLHAATRSYVDAGDAAANANADARVARAGDVMSGALMLSGPPALPLHAATMAYVDTGDAAANANANTRVLRAGDAMTGLLTLSGPPTANLHAATKAYVDTGDTAANANANTRVLKAGDTMTGPLVIQGNALISKIHSSADGNRATLAFGTIGNDQYHIYRNSGATGLHIDAIDAVGTARSAFNISRIGVTTFSINPVSGTPTVANQVAIKSYVDTGDTAANANANTRVLKAGDTMTGGLAFGSATSSGPNDLTRHIALWGGATPTTLGFGFSITSGTLNYNVNATTNQHDFYTGANHVMRLGNTELAMQGARDVRARRFIATTDNQGFATFDDGWFYKATGTGLVIRCNTGNQQPQIENNNGSNRRAILDANDTTRVRRAGDSMTGGLSFGSTVATSPTDLTRHIALFQGAAPTATGFGFSVTTDTLNYTTTQAANNHDFYCGTAFIARLNNTQLAMQGTRGIYSGGALTINSGGLQINAGNLRQKSTSANGADGGQVHSWMDASDRVTGEIRVSQNGQITGNNHQGSFEFRVNTGTGIQRVAYTRYGAAPRLALDADPVNPEDVATRRYVDNATVNPAGPWQTIPPSANWTSAVAPLRCRWVLHATTGSIEIQGRINSPVDYNGALATAATLPLGFRPVQTNVQFSVSVYVNPSGPYGVARVVITTGGAIQVQPILPAGMTGNIDFYLSGLVFPLT